MYPAHSTSEIICVYLFKLDNPTSLLKTHRFRSLFLLSITIKSQMGKLINNHWARLIVLIAAAVQIGGSIEGLIWPKITW